MAWRRFCPAIDVSEQENSARELRTSICRHAVGNDIGCGMAALHFQCEMRNVWFDHRLAAKLRDEAPSAYKDIHAVMRAQRELTRIVRKLRTILSYKGA